MTEQTRALLEREYAAKDVKIELRVSPEQKASWQAAADARGVKLSKWIRMVAEREVLMDKVSK
jgi:hypothetical protein